MQANQSFIFIRTGGQDSLMYIQDLKRSQWCVSYYPTRKSICFLYSRAQLPKTFSVHAWMLVSQQWLKNNTWKHFPKILNLPVVIVQSFRHFFASVLLSSTVYFHSGLCLRSPIKTKNKDFWSEIKLQDNFLKLSCFVFRQSRLSYTWLKEVILNPAWLK